VSGSNSLAKRTMLSSLENNLAGISNYVFGTQSYNTAIENVILEAKAYIFFVENSIVDDTISFVETVISLLESLLESSTSQLENEVAENEIADQNTGISYYPNYLYNDVRERDPFILNATEHSGGLLFDNDAKQRFTFHSPDTSFFQPTLGNI